MPHKKKKPIWKVLNITIALIVFSLFVGLLIFGAVFDFYERWQINASISALVLLIGSILSLIYLTWALLNWRLSKVLR